MGRGSQDGGVSAACTLTYQHSYSGKNDMNTLTENKNIAQPQGRARSGAAAFNRRAFVRRVLTAGAAANVAGLALKSGQGEVQAAELGPVSGSQRRSQVYQIR